MAYTISAGDTLSSIAAKNKTTVADIMKANPNIKDANKIQSGASLNMPTSMGITTPFPGNKPSPLLPTAASQNTASRNITAQPSPLKPTTASFTQPSPLKPTNQPTNTQQIFSGQNVSNFASNAPTPTSPSTSSNITINPSQAETYRNMGYTVIGNLAIAPQGKAPVTPSTTPATVTGGSQGILGGGNVSDYTKGAGSTTPTNWVNMYTAQNQPAGQSSPVTGTSNVQQQATQQSFQPQISAQTQAELDALQQKMSVPSTPQPVTQPNQISTQVQQPSANDLTYQGLLQRAIEAQRASQQFNQSLAQGSADIAKQAIPLGFVQGQQAALQRDYGVQQQALAQQAENALKAAGLAAPVQVTPGTALVSPTSGKEQYSGLGGLVGLGIAQQNIQQGQQYQQQALDLNNAMGLVKRVGNSASQFLADTKLNPLAAPFLNRPIQDYMAVADPAAKASWAGVRSELISAMSQILQSTGGLTPTAASELANAADPSLLNPTQLQQYIQNIDALGNMRLAQYQNLSRGSYSAGTTPYSGQAANQAAGLQATTPNTGILNYAQNPYGQAAMGTAYSAVGAAANAGNIGAAIAGGLFDRLIGLIK